MIIPAIAEDPMYAPPWKAVNFYGQWEVTTDRGNERDEYDVFECAPEWAVKLAAVAPELLSICENALSCGVLDARSGLATAEIIRRIMAVKVKLEPKPCSNP